MNRQIWAQGILVLTIAFAASPFLTDGFGGFTKDQFPVQLDHWPAQPAGWAFSIWGVIYAWLIISAAFGVWRRANWEYWQVARPTLALSLGIGVFWIAAANAAPLVATGMILIMAIAAIYAMLRSGTHDPWTLSGPIGLYAGWLTAASGVAVAVDLSGYGILGGQTAALIALSLVLMVGLGIQALRPALYTYPAAIVWALIGVIAANFSAAHWPSAALAALGIIAFAYRTWALNRRDLAAPAII
ncbi:hypothetical protein [Yoonia sp. BS5-3]|uniref:Tryptophan-rich sensory protein n=1 Tax=Yoonia phaeophyticola TaxID=3137369 RepID=A0ABZ2V1Y9_9RHOB